MDIKQQHNNNNAWRSRVLAFLSAIGLKKEQFGFTLQSRAQKMQM